MNFSFYIPLIQQKKYACAFHQSLPSSSPPSKRGVVDFFFHSGGGGTPMYASILTTQIICTVVDIIYTLYLLFPYTTHKIVHHTASLTRLYNISIFSNRLVLILTNIPDLGCTFYKFLYFFCMCKKEFFVFLHYNIK